MPEHKKITNMATMGPTTDNCNQGTAMKTTGSLN